MVVPGDIPAIALGEVGIGDAIAIGILKPRDLSSLRYEEVIAVHRQPERLVQARSIQPKLEIPRILRQGILHNPDFSFSNRECEFLSHPRHPADFESQSVTWLPLLGSGITGRTGGQEMLNLVAHLRFLPRGKPKPQNSCQNYNPEFHFHRYSTSSSPSFRRIVFSTPLG